MKTSILWDGYKAQRNAQKHGITFALAQTVFADPLAVTVRDSQHSSNEERWITIGCSAIGAVLLVVHTAREHGDELVVRIISARKPSPKELQGYQEGL